MATAEGLAWRQNWAKKGRFGLFLGKKQGKSRMGFEG